jgi:hypothetical protein
MIYVLVVIALGVGFILGIVATVWAERKIGSTVARGESRAEQQGGLVCQGSPGCATATADHPRPLGATPRGDYKLVVWDPDHKYVLGSCRGLTALHAHDVALAQYGGSCWVQKWEYAQPEERLIADVMDSARVGGVR